MATTPTDTDLPRCPPEDTPDTAAEATATAELRRGTSFPELVTIMERLRVGCPWDREQTHDTLKPYLIEETHEALEAIEDRDDAALCEELGDVLLQVVFHAELLREKGAYGIDDVVGAISEKLVRRHPHVFGDVQVDGTRGVMRNWYEFKAAERKKKRGDDASVLTGVPRSLPALLRAQRLGEKAASVGFDWPDANAVLDKVEEEIRELREAIAHKSKADAQTELGDLCFALAQLARKLGIDAEDGTAGTCNRFTARFQHMEAALRERGEDPKSKTLDELEAMWVEAKKALG